MDECLPGLGRERLECGWELFLASFTGSLKESFIQHILCVTVPNHTDAILLTTIEVYTCQSLTLMLGCTFG